MDLFVVVVLYASEVFIFADLTRPVLMALHFRVLFQVGQHHNERNFFLLDHSPETANRCLKGTLGRDEKLVIPLNRGVDVVGVDVRVGDVFVSLDETHAGVLD